MSETERPEREQGGYDPGEDPDTDPPASGDDPLAESGDDGSGADEPDDD